MKKRLTLLLIGLVAGTAGLSQDFHLSQYDAAALNMNPGMTGVFKGDYRIHGHYRNQWMAVATKPFVTGVVNFDANRGKWGWGAQIANFRAGVGGYNVFQFMPSAAYKFAIDKKKEHFFSLGAGIGVFQKSIKASSLTWANQYVKTNGGEFNTTLPSNENFAGNGIFNLDINLGLMYFWAKPGSQINPMAGLTVFHVNNPTETFLDESNRLPLRYQAVIASRFVLTEKISLTPKIFFQFEKEAAEMTWACDGQYYLSDHDLFILAGITYRGFNPATNDAAILMVGAKYANFVARFSYDINTSNLKSVTNGRGGSELSLTYIFNRPNPNPVPTCPKL